MRQITFTDEQVKQLAHESIYHDHHLVRRKMLTLFLKAQGYAHHEIADLIQISPTTLRTYLDQFTAGGVDGLKPLHYAGKPNRLAEQHAAIIAHLEAAPPATLKEAQAKIEEASQLKRSLPQVRAFLQTHKLRRRKMKQLPKDGDPDLLRAQETFQVEQLEPLVQQAQQHTVHLFFVDAAHFVLLPCLGYLYSLIVRYLPSSPGRQRFNVLGALHASTHELVSITNATYINAAAVCALLEKLAVQFQDLPIVLILDNARYQKCQVVFETAARLHIRLVYLPPYSPHFNLIERLWKFTRKTVLYNAYYAKYDKFSAAITKCLSETHTTYKEELETWLNPKFQSFKNAKSHP